MSENELAGLVEDLNTELTEVVKERYENLCNHYFIEHDLILDDVSHFHNSEHRLLAQWVTVNTDLKLKFERAAMIDAVSTVLASAIFTLNNSNNDISQNLVAALEHV